MQARLFCDYFWTILELFFGAVMRFLVPVLGLQLWQSEHAAPRPLALSPRQENMPLGSCGRCAGAGMHLAILRCPCKGTSKHMHQFSQQPSGRLSFRCCIFVRWTIC